MRLSLLLITLVFVLSACDAHTSSRLIDSRPVDWRPFSLRLKEGMTEKAAIAAIGYQPDSASVRACGKGSGQFRCRMLNYDGNRQLVIIFQENKNGAWQVNSWLAL